MEKKEYLSLEVLRLGSRKAGLHHLIRKESYYKEQELKDERESDLGTLNALLSSKILFSRNGVTWTTGYCLSSSCEKFSGHLSLLFPQTQFFKTEFQMS